MLNKRDELAKALCRAAGGDPSCMVRLHTPTTTMQTPMGTVETVTYPENPVGPLWRYWRHSADMALELVRELERAG